MNIIMFYVVHCWLSRADEHIHGALQVARQVDVLDSKLREEIESSMSALQAILSNASQVK